MNKKALTLIIAAAVVIVGGIVVLSLQKPSTPATSPTGSDTTQSNNDGTVTAATLTYTDKGFSPSPLTVKPGDTVRVVNQSSVTLQLSSDPHPTHTNNPELNMEAIEPGKDAMLTVNRVGNWGYHNHEKSSDTGKLNVTE